eukprot:11183414-Ditylum_brightwellii.AAC.1
MGTKPLTGMTDQFLLGNQVFPPPVETVGECKTDIEEGASTNATWQTKYVVQVLSPLDRDIFQSCMDREFILALCQSSDQD